MHACTHAYMHACTCIQARIQYEFEDNWLKLAPEEMKEFKEAHGHLPAAELASEMKVFITMKKIMKVSSSTGSKGKGKPLSVLQHEGYNTEQLANVEKVADKEWDAILGSFAYFVDTQHRGNIEEQCTTKESVVAGFPAKSEKRKLKKTPTESSEPFPKKQKKAKKDSSSEEKGDEKEKLATRRRRARTRRRSPATTAGRR